MSYSIGYCRTKVNGCNQTLRVLNEDLSKLNNMNQVIGKTIDKSKEAVAGIILAQSVLSSGFKGSTARRHESRIEALLNSCKDNDNSINSIKLDISEKQKYVNKRISDVQSDLSYWQRQLELAEAEAENE